MNGDAKRVWSIVGVVAIIFGLIVDAPQVIAGVITYLPDWLQSANFWWITVGAIICAAIWLWPNKGKEEGSLLRAKVDIIRGAARDCQKECLLLLAEKQQEQLRRRLQQDIQIVAPMLIETVFGESAKSEFVSKMNDVTQKSSGDEEALLEGYVNCMNCLCISEVSKENERLRREFAKLKKKAAKNPATLSP